ncbi:MAG: hypothetical protein RL357_1391 [Pseudomonadota bacterium]
MSSEIARFNMIEQQVRPWNVLRPEVLDTLARVPREAFVPAHLVGLAHSDTDIPLNTRGAVMMSPKVEAKLVHDLELTGSENVLEIGTGSGYSSALLARHAKQVVTVEIDPELADTAKQRLSSMGINNVVVVTGDGANPSTSSGHGPYDAIVLSGSVGEVPEPLLNLLTPSGRLLCICGGEPIMQATLCFAAAASQPRRVLWDMNAPRLLNFVDAPAFVF